jgi:parallel beta-helix repeat protein
VMTGAGGIRGYGGEAGHHDVTVDGLVFDGFVHTVGQQPIAALQTGWRWTVRNVEVRNDSQVGVSLGSGSTIADSYLHHNGRFGLTCGPGDSFSVENTEIALNNTGGFERGNSGGAKCVGSDAGVTNVSFVGNYVHHNFGNGLWCDWACKYVEFEGNTVEYNDGIGIFYEASWDGRIVGNTVRQNCSVYCGEGTSDWDGAEIFLNNSQNVDISSNVVVARWRGVGGRDDDRGTHPLFGTFMLCNVTGAGNTIVAPSWLSYAVGNTHECAFRWGVS